MWPAVLVCFVLALAVTGPVWLTDRSFGGDWWLHIRLIQQQAEAWQALGHPTRFTSLEPVGALTPLPMMFGATWYALGGLLANLGLGAIGAYVLLHILVVWSSIFGMWWLSRIIGVSGPWAFVPGLALVSSAYYLGDVLGRGGFGEFSATQTLPLLFASLAEVVWSGRLRARAAAAIVTGSCIALGTHNISTLWTTTLGVIALAAILVRYPPVFMRVTGRVRLLTFSCVLFGALLPSWSLIPLISQMNNLAANDGSFSFEASRYFGNPFVWLSPIRWIPAEHVTFWQGEIAKLGLPFEGATSLFVQVPVLLLLWSIFVLAKRRCATKVQVDERFVQALLVPTLIIVMLLMFPVVWHALPDVYLMTQYSFRLISYLNILIAIFLAIALSVASKTSIRSQRMSGLGITLVALLSIGLAQMFYQSWTTVNFTAHQGVNYDVSRQMVEGNPFLANEWYDQRGPRANDGEIVDATDVQVAPSAFRQENLTLWRMSTQTPVGTIVKTPVVAPMDFVKFDGAEIVGRTSDGFVVVKTASPTVVANLVRTPWVVIGNVLSGLSLLGALSVLIFATVIDRRRKYENVPTFANAQPYAFSKRVVTTCTLIALVALALASWMPALTFGSSASLLLAQNAQPVSYVSASGMPKEFNFSLPCAAANNSLNPGDSRLIFSSAPLSLPRLEVNSQSGYVSMGIAGHQETWIGSRIATEASGCRIDVRVEGSPLKYALRAGSADAPWTLSSNIQDGLPKWPPIDPLFANPLTGMPAPATLSVSIVERTSAMTPGSLRAALLLFAAAIGIWHLGRLYADRLRSPLSMRGPRISRADVLVFVSLASALIFVPASFDDGWVLTTVRGYEQLGFFSNYFSFPSTIQPQGAWWNTIQGSYLNGADGLPAGLLRFSAFLFSCLTWVFLRRVFLEGGKGTDGRARKSTLALVSTFYVCGAIAWLVTLRPEALVGLLTIAAIYLVASYRLTGSHFYAAAALVMGGSAVAAHQSGFATLAVSLGLLNTQWSPDVRSIGRTGLTNAAKILAAPALITGFLVLLPGSIGQLVDGSYAFQQSDEYQKVLVETARWTELLSMENSGQNGLRRLMPMLALLVTILGLVLSGRLRGRSRLIVRLCALPWLGLLLTSSKWSWHFGVVFASSAVILGLIWPSLLEYAQERRWVWPTSLCLLGLLAVNASQTSPDWTQGFDAKFPMKYPFPFLSPSSIVIWILLLSFIAILMARRPERDRSHFAVAAPIAVMALTLASVLSPVVADASRPYSWINQQWSSLVGRSCGLAEQQVAVDVVPLQRGLADPSFAARQVTQLAIWPTTPANLDIYTQQNAGLSGTDWYRVPRGSALQGWFRSASANVQIRIQFSQGGERDQIDVVRTNTGAWLVWTAKVPAGAEWVRVEWEGSPSGVAVTQPVEIRSTAAAKDIVARNVWNNPQSYLQAPCFQPVNISSGTIPELDLSVGLPQWGGSSWSRLNAPVELACPGRSDQLAANVCLYGFKAELIQKK